jgi:CubicO group peptidase (beta-lactamase class C family)
MSSRTEARDTLSGGEAAAGYEGVRYCFERVLADRPGWSGGVCAYVAGRPVVDLWGGPRFSPVSLAPVWSCTKGAVSLAIALLLQRGLLDPEAPVAEYWPEFAVDGKSAVTIGELLSHQAGLVTVDGGISLDELAGRGDLASRLARQHPYWNPGSEHGYHALTFGVLAGELVRRVTATPVQAFYERELRAPIGADFYVGLPRPEEPRVVTCRPDASRVGPQELPQSPHSRPELLEASSTVSGAGDGWAWVENRRIREFGAPSVGGVSSARGLAQLYAGCVTGLDDEPPLLSAGTIEQVRAVRVDGWDLCLPLRTRFGLGFVLASEHVPMAGRGSFGHDGANGAIGFAQPEKRLAFGFVSDHVPPPVGADAAVKELVSAIEACSPYPPSNSFGV